MLHSFSRKIVFLDQLNAQTYQWPRACQALMELHSGEEGVYAIILCEERLTLESEDKS